ncbi:hypothetical protein [Micromonospora sagamiensis]|uniref:hypothetical protein n=1 Tax=Micromonospora sagamiensis TaxID=47875 RepID=UPI00119CC774|nr:hypothetical protein [Micromonospora sagamiensis]
MSPVVLDCHRWRSVRRAFRVFTSLAVAVALALSGGALAGGLSAGGVPALAGGSLSVGRLPVLVGSYPAHRVTADGVEPVARDEAGTPSGTGPAGGVPVVVVASSAVGQPPVRPLVGTDAGAAGSRAPPPR